MDWNLEEADEFIKKNTIDNEDWFQAEDNRKEALLNVAKRTIDRRLRNEDEEDEEKFEKAYYIFASTLASIYNEVMVQSQRGVASFSVRGINYTFKEWAVAQDLSDFIPEEVYDILELPKKSIKWTVM